MCVCARGCVVLAGLNVHSDALRGYIRHVDEGI